MATIHLIDGEKGGVGKSFVTRAMIQYRLDKNLPFVAVETDRSNPDVAGVYKEICKYAFFSEDEKEADKADRIFEYAMKKPVIVSLPSQVHRTIKIWMDRNQLLQLGSEYGVDFCKWFVCNGEYDSVKLFLASLKCYEPYFG
jgi:CO dehydrogenase nickel-insertion accessory protein CooC1